MSRRSFRKQKRRYILLLSIIGLLCIFAELAENYYRSWFTLPFSLHFTPKYLVLAPGDRHALRLNGIALRVSYESSDPLNATVTSGGMLYALSCGKATITATIHNRNDKQVECRVLVTSLNKERLTLDIGKRFQLKLSGAPKNISYKSSASDIVSVSRFGWLKAKKTGTAVITVTCSGKVFECRVTVP